MPVYSTPVQSSAVKRRPAGFTKDLVVADKRISRKQTEQMSSSSSMLSPAINQFEEKAAITQLPAKPPKKRSRWLYRSLIGAATVAAAAGTYAHVKANANQKIIEEKINAMDFTDVDDYIDKNTKTCMGGGSGILTGEKEKMKNGKNMIFIFFGSSDYLNEIKRLFSDPKTKFDIRVSNYTPKIILKNDVFRNAIQTNHDSEISLYIIDEVETINNEPGSDVAALDFLYKITDSIAVSKNVMVLLLFNLDTCKDKKIVTKLNLLPDTGKAPGCKDWRIDLANFFRTGNVVNNVDALTMRIGSAYMQKNSLRSVPKIGG